MGNGLVGVCIVFVLEEWCPGCESSGGFDEVCKVYKNNCFSLRFVMCFLNNELILELVFCLCICTCGCAPMNKWNKVKHAKSLTSYSSPSFPGLTDWLTDCLPFGLDGSAAPLGSLPSLRSLWPPPLPPPPPTTFVRENRPAHPPVPVPATPACPCPLAGPTVGPSHGNTEKSTWCCCHHQHNCSIPQLPPSGDKFLHRNTLRTVSHEWILVVLQLLYRRAASAGKQPVLSLLSLH